jgi:hypothetical protein
MVLVLFALVLLGVLVTAAVAVTRLDRATANNSVYAAEAQSAAEAGLVTLAAAWTPSMALSIPIWDGTPLTEWSGGLQSLGSNPLIVHVDSVRRLNRQLFLIRSIGRRLDAGGGVLAELEVGQLLRTVRPTVGVNAALTVVDPLSLTGNAFFVSGINTLPPSWPAGECDPLDSRGVDDLVGIRSASATGVQPADLDNVDGFPRRDVPADPSVTASTFTDFLDFTYSSLASQPGVKVLTGSPVSGVGPLVDATGQCDQSAPLNFGEPLRNPPEGAAVLACIEYRPVVNATGVSTQFAPGARGQGILLVDGDLDLVGGFEWAGLIIVRGQLTVTGTGNSIYGAVLARGGSIATGTAGLDLDLQYSACAVERALGGATWVRPLGQRSWFQVY